MDRTQTMDACAIESLESTNPQFQVGADRILDQYRYIYTLQSVSDLLHGEGVHRGARTNPQDVDACFQGLKDMILRSYLRSDQHTCFLFYSFQPRQA